MTLVAPLFQAGDKMTADITVLGAVDSGGRDPVYIVWNHRAWCPMACKVFRSARQARWEAKVLAAVAHPNIVRLLGIGKPPHVLMEFLEGPTLSGFISSQARRRLGVSDAVRVAIHVGGALTHIHERGFLHLDLKPSNILMNRGRPVLFDFGTARRREDTRRGIIEGSDRYMAPEQCVGDPLTPATDVFALGATLYRMLTGEFPFPEGSPKEPYPQTVMDPIPIRSRRRGVPAALEEHILTCLAREPLARPSSPAAMLPFLHSFIRRGPLMWPADFRPAEECAQPAPAAEPRSLSLVEA